MGKCICLSRVSTGVQDLDQQTDQLLAAARSNGYSDEEIIKIEDIESGIKLSEEERYWKFRCKVTPCVPSQTDPLVRLKMTPWS